MRVWMISAAVPAVVFPVTYDCVPEEYYKESEDDSHSSYWCNTPCNL